MRSVVVCTEQAYTGLTREQYWKDMRQAIESQLADGNAVVAMVRNDDVREITNHWPESVVEKAMDIVQFICVKGPKASDYSMHMQ